MLFAAPVETSATAKFADALTDVARLRRKIRVPLMSPDKGASANQELEAKQLTPPRASVDGCVNGSPVITTAPLANPFTTELV
jgi:hypothetical protein